MQEVVETYFLDVEENEELREFVKNVVQTCFKV